MYAGAIPIFLNGANAARCLRRPGAAFLVPPDGLRGSVSSGLAATELLARAVEQLPERAADTTAIDPGAVTASSGDTSPSGLKATL